MLNYESKTADALKTFKTPVPGQTRTEGIAVSRRRSRFTSLWQNRRDYSAATGSRRPSHFYNRDASKAYVTALGKGELRVIDMSKRPFA